MRVVVVGGGGFLGQHLTLLNIGNSFAKVTTIASPLYADSLRSFPGFEDALIVNPAAGEKWHAMQLTSMALRDNTLRVEGFDNLFCAGNKASAGESYLDAMCVGELAGHNAVRRGLGQPGLELPKTLAAGAYIDFAGRMMRTKEGRKRSYSLLSAELLKSWGVFRENEEEIVREVDKAGLRGLYQTKLC